MCIHYGTNIRTSTPWYIQPPPLVLIAIPLEKRELFHYKSKYIVQYTFYLRQPVGGRKHGVKEAHPPANQADPSLATLNWCRVLAVEFKLG